MLNPDAEPFVPCSATPVEPVYSHEYHYDDTLDADLTEDELAELEAAEEWVELMADLEASEQEHIISTALSVFPAAAEVLEQEVKSNARSRSAGKGRRSPS